MGDHMRVRSGILSTAVVLGLGVFPPPQPAYAAAPGGNGQGQFPYNCNNGCGTVFALYPPSTRGGPWTGKVIHNFQGSTVAYGGDGAHPTSGVVFDENGVLYGTTSAGGLGNSGTVYRMRPPAEAGGEWTETVIYNIGYTMDQP